MTPLSRLRSIYDSRRREFGVTDRGRVEIRVRDLELVLAFIDAAVRSDECMSTRNSAEFLSALGMLGRGDGDA